MASIVTWLNAPVDWLLRTTWQAAILALLVLTVTWLLRRRLPPSARYALLLLVAARLLLPITPQSPFSIFNLIQTSNKTSTPQVTPDPTPTGDWIITKQPLSQPLTQIPATLSTPTPDLLTWRTGFATLWLLGVLVMAFRIAHANLNLSRQLRRATLVDDPHLLHLLNSCKSQMHIRRELIILETSAIHSPALMGLFRPRLLLPANLRHRLSDSEMRFVFLHELAHLKQNDIAIDWLLAILQTLHWFNPLIHLAFARARSERELARDAMVLRAGQPDDQLNYGHTILKLVESFARLGPRPGTIGILEGNNGKQDKKHLKRRITMIANFKRSMPGSAFLTSIIAIILVAITLTDKKAIATADPTPAEKPAKTDAASQPNGLHPQPFPAPIPADPPPIDEKARRDAATQAILDRRLPEVRFDKVAFSDAVDFLRDVTSANIFVNWKALEAAGIEKNAPVSARMRDIKFSKALTTLVNDVGGGAVKLGFEIDDGVIIISTAEELNKNTEVHVYDIRDLLALTNDAKQTEQTAKEKTEALVSELTKLIQETIDRDTWRDNGGPIGSIRHLNGQLIVTQTRENQKQLVQLLDKLRETRVIQITVKTRLMKVSNTLLKDIGVDLPLDDNLLKDAVVQKKADKPAHTLVGLFLDDTQAEKLVKAVQASVDSTILIAPRITLFNGQQGSIVLGEEIPYIAGWSEPKDGKRDPQISMVKTGFMFNLQPTVNADRKYVTLSLHPRLAKLRKMEDVPWPKAAPGEKLNINKPDLAVQEIDTIVSIPDGGTLLTLLPESDDKPKDPRALLNILLVRPTIIIQREADQK
ncbi:MAG TPA: M56 family metallopeptidase [Tepidisphaeraceae bacterium]|jgi:beta-lactamase regulating signal transducer with metallopeptidase domain|nr:M56 family metallopeptidase [Tepidisphaeraceae bacterium]